MIAFLISVAPFIPAALSIAGLLIKWFGTSEANLKAYQEMIENNKDSGLISAETYKKLSDFHQQMLKEWSEKNGKNPPLPPEPQEKGNPPAH